MMKQPLQPGLSADVCRTDVPELRKDAPASTPSRRETLVLVMSGMAMLLSATSVALLSVMMHQMSAVGARTEGFLDKVEHPASMYANLVSTTFDEGRIRHATTTASAFFSKLAEVDWTMGATKDLCYNESDSYGGYNTCDARSSLGEEKCDNGGDVRSGSDDTPLFHLPATFNDGHRCSWDQSTSRCIQQLGF